MTNPFPAAAPALSVQATLPRTGRRGKTPLYGWTINPLAESRIVEDWWTNNKPRLGFRVGAVFTDERSCGIDRRRMFNQPSPMGTAAYGSISERAPIASPHA
ncbi:MAG: glycoside hydrolase family 11 protein [Spirochaetales bacterium]|nr:glycoside hydrolase family 11 protein [Spirochaetales bacterium]